MADPWVLLLAGSTLVVVGFLAAQVFDRHRVPDYIVLLALGIVLGSGVVPVVGADTRDSLAMVAPVLTNLALAFILFEGGLALRGRPAGQSVVAVAGHTVAAMAASGLGVWLVSTQVLGLNNVTAVVLAAAFVGPSAAIVLSVLPGLRVTSETRVVLTLEGVLGNVLAVAVVLVFVRFPGTVPDPGSLAWYGASVGASALAGAALGFAWHRTVGSVRPRSFSFMTTVALAVFLYAVGDGLLGGTGGVAAFAFGLVLGRKRTLALRDGEADQGTPGRRGLPEFHRELVFLLRTFFFLYLGLRIQLASIDLVSTAGAVAFVAIFLASRVPSTAVLARIWVLPRLDVRILHATVARGMTDTVLVLYAIQVGVVPPNKADLVTSLLFLVVLFAAGVSALLVALAERAAATTQKGPALGASPESALAGLQVDPIDDPPPR